MQEQYLGSDIKKLGFGLMRLPTVGDGGWMADIDIEQTKKMADDYIKAGFTYFDTAYVYGDGKSENAARDAVVRRYPRETFQLADKMPLGKASSTEDLKKLFKISLERTEAGYFDFYLLHAMGKDLFKKAEEIGAWEFLKDMKAQGKIRHMGFSFHDTADVLDEALTRHPETEFVQLQINYADWESPTTQSRLCYEVARKHNKPVIIMEPVKGGMLAKMSDDARNVMEKARPDMSVPSWAIRYAASLDGVITVLSGMSDIEQMTDNLKTMADFEPLTSQDESVIDQVKEILASIELIACTDCKYCVADCPQKINIPGVFRVENDRRKFDNTDGCKMFYGFVTGQGGKASDCIACGNCEERCPQHLPIIELLKDAAATFEG